MNLRVSGISMAEISWCKHNGFLIENLSRRDRIARSWKKYSLCETIADQLDEQSTAIPILKCWSAKIDIVDLDSLRDNILSQTFQKRFPGLHFIKCGVDKI